MDKIAVLIPCYNEEQTIAAVVRDYKAALPEATIYVYDNNSKDKTSEIAAAAGAVVRREYQQGKGNVIRRMFREIDAECYLMVDGDDTYPAGRAREMVDQVLDKKVDMVIGDRLSSTYFTENKRRFHNSGNVLVRKAINTLFKSEIKDILTGLRAFSYLFVKTFPVLSKGFEIETEMSIHAVDKNMSVTSVLVDYQDRPAGSESKLNTVSDGIKVLGTIFNLLRNYRPFFFFTAGAVLLFGVALGFFIPIAIDFVQTHEVLKMPSLVIISMVAMLSFLSFAVGMILDVIRLKNRQDFEERLHHAQDRLRDLLGK